jgi:hypothetical protein
MKNSKKCPKCQSTDIVRISDGWMNYIKTGMTFRSAVKITRRLCASCGFIEEWIDSAEDIAKVKKRFGAAPG